LENGSSTNNLAPIPGPVSGAIPEKANKGAITGNNQQMMKATAEIMKQESMNN
jgi:hypothetical protein